MSGPYSLGLEIKALMAKDPLITLDDVSDQMRVSKQLLYDRLQLARLDPRIGKSLDTNPTWLRNAVSLCKHPTETQLKLWWSAENYDWRRFYKILERVKRGEPRSVAQDTHDSLMMDVWPRLAAIVDFGLQSAEHLGALQHAIRSGVCVWELDMVLGSGDKITQLCRQFKNNPYGHVTFDTPYDHMGPEEE